MKSWLCTVVLTIALAVPGPVAWSESADSVNWKAWLDNIRSLANRKSGSQTSTKHASLLVGFTEIGRPSFINLETGEISFDHLQPQYVPTGEDGHFDPTSKVAEGLYSTHFRPLPNSQEVPTTTRFVDSEDSLLFRANHNPMYDISVGRTPLDKANESIPNEGNVWPDLLYPQVGLGWDKTLRLKGVDRLDKSYAITMADYTAALTEWGVENGLLGRINMRKNYSFSENLDVDKLSREKDYESAFVWSPIKVIGATGSPGNPVAAW